MFKLLLLLCLLFLQPLYSSCVKYNENKDNGNVLPVLLEDEEDLFTAEFFSIFCTEPSEASTLENSAQNCHISPETICPDDSDSHENSTYHNPLIDDFEKSSSDSGIQSIIEASLLGKFNSQHPGKTFSFSKYTVSNWPNDINMFKIGFSQSEMIKIYSIVSELIFVEKIILENDEILPPNNLKGKKRKIKTTVDDQIATLTMDEFLSIDVLNDYIDHDVVFEDHQQSNTDETETLPKRKVQKRKRKTETETQNCTEAKICTERKNSKIKIVLERRNLKNELELKFHSQHPGIHFNLRQYDVLNGPDDINIYKTDRSFSDISKIRACMNDLIFVKRCTPFSIEDESGLDLLDVDDILVKHWSRKTVEQVLLKRFREETGDTYAERIDYYLLDRSFIPIKYAEFKINTTMMRFPKFYQNPEIVDNIHFIQIAN